MEFGEGFNVGTNAHLMIILEDALGFVDNTGSVRLFDAATNKMRKTQTIAGEAEYPYFKGDASRGAFLCLYQPQEIATRLYVYDKISAEFNIKSNLAWSLSATETAEFSTNAQMLAVGDNKGKVCLYSTENGELISVLPACGEYISAIAFNGDSSLIAYASFKQNMIIYDLDRFKLLSDFYYKDVICVVKFFSKTSLLIAGARDNKVFIFDAIGGYVVRDLITTINWPLAIFIDDDEQFAFISDKSGYLYLVDLSATEQSKEPIFNSKKAIVDIKKRGEIIYFLFEHGKVTFIDLSIEREKLQNKIAERDINGVTEALNSNPILKFAATGLLNNLDGEFDKKFQLAVVYMAQNKLELAKETMGKLLTFPIYKRKFDSIVKHISKVTMYYQLIQTGQYKEAYNMANEGEFYRKLPLFAMLEKRFADRFTEALEAIIANGEATQKAKDELALFSKIPQKTMVIRNMFKNPEIFKKANNYFDKKEWKNLANTIYKFDMLRDSPKVLEFTEMIQKKEEEFFGFMAAGKYDEAIDVAKFLRENSTTNSPTLNVEFDKLEIVENFTQLVDNKQYSEAIKKAVENPFLVSSKAYIRLNEMLSIRFKAAHAYATQARFDMTDKMLRPFLGNSFTLNRAIAIYKILYLAQIAMLGDKMKESHWLNALKNYVTRFGVDSEIELLAKKFNVERYIALFRNFKNANFVRNPIIPHIVNTPFVKS
ncbi:MAG: hypothetical protein LBU73_08100 [Helicobacteraceae bacterium]|nr:hypothetical protein [Helicobacteraceae bacterium]